MNDIYRLLMIIALFAVHHFLSTRDKWQWGAILPVAVPVGFIILQMAGTLDWSVRQMVIIIVLVELFLLGNWYGLRKAVAEHRKKELARMRAQDI